MILSGCKFNVDVEIGEQIQIFMLHWKEVVNKLMLAKSMQTILLSYCKRFVWKVF
jgi:hypothetical protein